jgi:diguanylate cyclase (GGDEF)-like protein
MPWVGGRPAYGVAGSTAFAPGAPAFLASPARICDASSAEQPACCGKVAPDELLDLLATPAGLERRTMTRTSSPAPQPWSMPGEFLYGGLLFVGAIGALWLLLPAAGGVQAGWTQVLFFLLFGLFTISIGYGHPSSGYVSFDRVAQVSSILVLGPVDAAWIGGIASLLYPWHRLRKGQSLATVGGAALTNSGLMCLVILAGGFAYTWIGGRVPLGHLDPRSVVAVLGLLFTMQVVNEAGIMVLMRIRGPSARGSLSLFDTATELTAGLIAVLVAIVWTRMEVDVLLLLLTVLAVGMAALRTFAEMRLRLERLVDERTAALQKKTLELERLASLDTLTGLYNRRHADEFLELALDGALRDGATLSFALADVDHFKQINDGHSHATGDRVLERVARILESQVRGCDLVARYGGEEFLFCLVGMDAADAAGFCESIRLTVARQDWAHLSPGLEVTMSIGVATRREERSVAALLDAADACLYRAKDAGRNRVVCR